MQPGANLHRLLLLLLLLRFSDKAASLNICNTANLTVVNAAQESRVVTVTPSTIVTFACWTWCAVFVDWSPIVFSDNAVKEMGVARYTCSGEAGPCVRGRGNPNCSGVQPGSTNVTKFELSLLVTDTFYIECMPHCTFDEGDKQVGRTKGLLVRVRDPPTRAAVTSTLPPSKTFSQPSSSTSSLVKPTSSIVRPTSSIPASQGASSSLVPPSPRASPSVIPTGLTIETSSTPTSKGGSVVDAVTTTPLFPVTVVFSLIIVFLFLFLITLILLWTRTKRQTTTA